MQIQNRRNKEVPVKKVRQTETKDNVTGVWAPTS